MCLISSGKLQCLATGVEIGIYVHRSLRLRFSVMERRGLQKRIDALVREKRNLQISISQMKENLSKRLDNLSQTERNDFGCR